MLPKKCNEAINTIEINEIIKPGIISLNLNFFILLIFLYMWFDKFIKH